MKTSSHFMNKTDLHENNLVKPGAWLTLGSPVIAEIAACYPFDWMLFDLEHGCGTEATLMHNFQAARRNGLSLIVRIGKFDAALVARIMDWGATGIMLPHTDTAEQAKVCIAAMRHPPHGTRGYSGSARCFEFGNSVSKGPSTPLFFAQIESEEAVKNVEAIAGVEGVDVVFAGPADLRLDLECRESATSLEQAIQRVVEGARRCGKQAGIVTKGVDDFKKYAGMGFQYISYASDLLMLKEGFKKVHELKQLRTP
jgi:2-dehydro-3-deoxyglucarate aldolase/4-hydroxy-2-oxoheptanedioate aldolase